MSPYLYIVASPMAETEAQLDDQSRAVVVRDLDAALVSSVEHGPEHGALVIPIAIQCLTAPG
jgi:hypothetical protein